MRYHAEYSRSGRALALVAAAALASAISSVPAGIGNLGLTSTLGTGDGTDVDCTFNPTISQPIGAGQPISQVRDGLIAQIDPNSFTATSVVDPDDPNSNSFSITKVGGDDIAHLQLCENDPSVDNLGVSLAGGRTVASLNRVTSLNSNGNYILKITTLNHGVKSQTFNTAAHTPATLNAAIVTAFTASGFIVSDDGTNLKFRLPGDTISAIRVSATDSGVVTFCLDLSSPASVPATGPLAMFLLVIALTASAIWMMRRGAAARTTRP